MKTTSTSSTRRKSRTSRTNTESAGATYGKWCAHSEHCGRGEQGTVAIEFVLIVPIILLLVFGIIEFGRAYNAKVELTAAVREGVRELALGEGDGIDATVAAAPGLDADEISVTTSGSPCTGGTAATVTATYPFDLDIPFWGAETLDIRAEGVMRCGG